MDSELSKNIDSVVKHFKPNSKIVVLTGAGISEESGIPTFRGKGGLWEKYDPAETATAEALMLRPKKVWEMHNSLRQILSQNKPNPGHFAIAELEQLFKNVTVITQNVDNYHQDAGSTNVLELHGNAWRVKCTEEDKSWIDKTVPYKELPPKCKCGADLRPDVVFFNEPLDQDILNTAFDASKSADIMFVMGTSYVVIPAAYLPILAKESGAVLIDINIEFSPIATFPDASLIGKSGEILPELITRIKSNLKKKDHGP
jgi:NAD-dependent deacetylase